MIEKENPEHHGENATEFKSNIFISKTCKQVLQLNIKKQSTQEKKMGQRPKWMYLQRRHRDGHKTREKILSITVREMPIKLQ